MVRSMCLVSGYSPDEHELIHSFSDYCCDVFEPERLDPEEATRMRQGSIGTTPASSVDD